MYSSPLMDNGAWTVQKRDIERLVHAYLGEGTTITSRALRALQVGTYRGDTGSLDSEMLLQSLRCSSPAIEAHLNDCDLCIPRYDIDEANESPGNITSMTWLDVFVGDYETVPEETPMVPAARHVKQKGVLTDLDLFLCIAQAGMGSPYSYSHAGWMLLLNWDLDSWGRTEAGDKRLEELCAHLNLLAIEDPSFHDQQWLMYLDRDKRLRIRPFAAFGTQQLEEVHREGRDYLFRGGILQPSQTVSRFVTDDAILLLEDMVASSRAREADFQQFFRDNPELLMGLDYARIHSQLVLYRDDGTTLIPDFFLEPLDGAFCDILELKLPYPQFVRRLRRSGRSMFRSCVNAAIAQLVDYAKYFDDKANREAFRSRYGLDVYEPRLVVVIGRAHHFLDDVNRRELAQLLPNRASVWTYDDLVNRAKAYHELAGLPLR